jgi:hypothetical protein
MSSKQPFPVSLYSSPSKKRFANQKGIKRPVFLFVKSVISDSNPVYQLSENSVQKRPIQAGYRSPAKKRICLNCARIAILSHIW